MEFEWDPAKAERNAKKHGVTFQEAATVFSDPWAMTYADPGHSDEEDRYLTFGESSDGRFVVVYSVRREMSYLPAS
jgi:uncharacterized DUF497 family protein